MIERSGDLKAAQSTEELLARRYADLFVNATNVTAYRINGNQSTMSDLDDIQAIEHMVDNFDFRPGQPEHSSEVGIARDALAGARDRRREMNSAQSTWISMQT